MKNTLRHCFVNGLDGGGIGALGLLLIGAGGSGLEFLEGGLQSGLLLLVLLGSDTAQLNSLLRRLNVGHRYTSSNSVPNRAYAQLCIHVMRLQIIPCFFRKINREFQKNKKFSDSA